MTETEDGYRGDAIDPTGVITDTFPNPFSSSGSQSVAAAGSHTFSFSIDDEVFVYYIRKIVVTPQANVNLLASVEVQDVAYGSKAGAGSVEFDYGQDTPLYCVDGDTFEVIVTNLDASTRTMKVNIWGIKVARSGGVGRAPAAYFSVDDQTVILGVACTFTDESTYIPTSWDWDFGDESDHSTEQNPTHTYAEVGSYTVTLKVTNAYGYDILIKNNYVVVAVETSLDSYTEVDTSTRILVEGGQATVTAMLTGEECFLYGDYGVDYFNAYEIRWALKVTAATLGSTIACFMMHNQVAAYDGTGIHLVVSVYTQTGGAKAFRLSLYNGGTELAYQLTDSWTVGTQYYLKVVHAADSTTVNLYVYSDATYSTLVTSAAITNASVNTKWRYHFAIAGRDSSSTYAQSWEYKSLIVEV